MTAAGAGLQDTLHMVGWSTLIAIVGGLPLGVLLPLTGCGGLLQNVAAGKVIGRIVNVARTSTTARSPPPSEPPGTTG